MSIFTYLPPAPSEEELKKYIMSEEDIKRYQTEAQMWLEEYRRKYPDDWKPDHLK